MKKKIITYALAGMLIVGVGFCTPVMVEASNLTANVYQSSSDKLVLRADVIETKTRIYHGRQQYRRWNKTRGKWVDPAWIDL